jgi:hypothetical protein
MMSTQTSALYPPGGFGAPKYRRGHARGNVGLPAGTKVFSADEKSLAAVIEAVGPDNAARIVSANIKKFLGV